jgi:hypothetical protein
MTITVHCSHPSCGRILRAKDDLAGQRVKCPGCGNAVRVPACSQAVEVPPTGKQTAATGGSRAVKQAVAPRPAPPANQKLTPLEQDWEKSPLLRQNVYQLNRKVWVRKYGPDFNISRPGKKDVTGSSDFKPGTLATVLGLFGLHSFVPMWIEVSDLEGPLFRMKQVKLVNNRYDIYDPTGKEHLSSIKTVFSLSMALRLLDPEGQDTGEVVGADLLAVDKVTKYFGFNVRASDGAKLGDITSVAFHYARHNLKSKGLSLNAGYVGTVAQAYADDPRVRALILATTIVALIEGVGMNQFDPMKA